jgi:hypothetical protein
MQADLDFLGPHGVDGFEALPGFAIRRSSREGLPGHPDSIDSGLNSICLNCSQQQNFPPVEIAPNSKTPQQLESLRGE